MAKKPKRKTAAEIAADLLARKRQDFEAVNLPGDAATLERNVDIEITRAGQKRDDQKVQEDSARRLDAFAALKDGMTKDPKYVGCYDAARRLEADLLMRRGEADKGRAMERVDGDGLYDLTDRIIAAGEAADAIANLLSKRDWWLLHELMTPAREYDGGWRGVVGYITGETNWNAQGAAVRAACVNLRDAYEALDIVPRKAA